MQALLKAGALGLVLAALGLPINGLLGFGLLAVAGVIVLCGRVSVSSRRWLMAMALAAGPAAIQFLLPVPMIEEGHNAFVFKGPGEPLEAGLPAAVFGYMARQFDATYPPDKRCDPARPGCWRAHGSPDRPLAPGDVCDPAATGCRMLEGMPDRPFALSADAIFQRPKYSRRISSIDFADPTWSRLGFVNEYRYHWYKEVSDIQRSATNFWYQWILRGQRTTMPYFVMYVFPRALVGSRLCWRGDLLWEHAPGRFTPLPHRSMGCRTLRADDVGRRVFGVSIRTDAPLAVRLEPSGRVRLVHLAAAAGRLAAVAGILLLLVATTMRRLALPMALTAGAAVVSLMFDPALFGGYRPHEGGNDGLVHAGFGRMILQHLADGEIARALMGGEPVFIFMPGLRYFRALENILFGDTNFGYLAVVLILPMIVFKAFRLFLPFQWTLATTAVFVATPFSMLLGSSFFQYAKKASQGFPEPLGYAAFLGGLVLILGQLSGRDDGRGAPAFWGGLLMALAVFARPNLAISAAVILGAAAWWLLRRRRLGVLWALALGFLPILLVPAHNWIYGHQLVPLTAAAFHPTNFRAPPTMYLSALVELASLHLGGDNLWRAVVQLVGWLSGASRFPPMIPVHVAALVILVRVTARGGAYGFRLRTLGLATLGMHLVLVFWRSEGRYALLAWLLTLLVNLAWLQRGGLIEIDRRFPRATAYLRGLPGLARAKTGLAACERIIGPLYPRQTPADAGQPGRAGLS